MTDPTFPKQQILDTSKLKGYETTNSVLIKMEESSSNG